MYMWYVHHFLLMIQVVVAQQSNNEIKKIKKEINKLSKVKYKKSYRV